MRARLNGCNATRAVLKNVVFRYADLSHAILSGCDATDAVFEQANLHRSERTGMIDTGAIMHNARLTDPELARAEDFQPGGA